MRVLLLPSVPYEPLRRLNEVGEHPRPMVTEELRDHGIFVDSIDPDIGWKNPFGRMTPFYRAFDPLRILRVLIARRNYDLVVSGNDSAAAALIEARWLFRFKTPIVIWDFSPAMHWRSRRIAQDRAIPRVNGVIVLNDIQQPYIAQRWGAHVPVVVVHHWVDTEFYRPMAPGSQPVLLPDAQCAMPSDTQCAMPLDTPRAMPADGCSALLPDARGPILAVGDDSGRDYATLLRALEGLSTRTLIRTGLPLDLNERHGGVAVLRDRLTPLAFRQLYAGSRFVVVPLRLDTRNASGISTIMEAAAMGKAVIASDSDGIRGAVRHEETGLVVPANDPTALRTAIERLLREPATCDRLGQEARRRIERTAAPAVFAGRLAAAFRALGRH